MQTIAIRALEIQRDVMHEDLARRIIHQLGKSMKK